MNTKSLPQPLSGKKFSRSKEFWATVKYFTVLEIFFAVMMASFNFGGKVVFGILIGIPPLIALGTGSRKAYQFILYFICILFAMGQRTIHIGHYFRIVPSAIILWGIAVVALFTRPQFPSTKKTLPWSVLILSLSSALGIFIGFNNSQNVNLGFMYAHMMWMSIPAFLVAHRFAQRIEHIQTIVNVLSMGCLFLSFLGIAEYYGLGFIRYFSGFIQGKTLSGQEEFTRMAATFWGGPMMAGYISMCFPLILAHFFSSKTMTQKGISLISLTLCFVAIYLSGHRGVWLPVLFSLIIYFYLKGIKGILYILILITIGIHFIPQGAKTRLGGLYGEQRDSSSIKREGRAREAWEMIKENPVVGSGWGASGLVHSDFIQIWADAGFTAFSTFVWIYLMIFKRLLGVVKTHNKIFKEYCYGFFAAILSTMGILLQQTWLNLPELYTPFWFVMALAYQYPNIISIENKIEFAYYQSAMGRVERNPNA